ncbi:MAG: SPOR domain-containing protein [Alicyclobacillaceae bacterium]|nr:SPOR domain-containing protein [Alicyclobacillaceae bacterium]
MDKAKITVRWKNGRPIFRPGLEDNGETGGSVRPLPRNVRERRRSDQAFGRTGVRWAIPMTVALAVGSVLGWICVEIFARAGGPSTPAPMSNIHLYLVQAGAFSDRARAEVFSENLRKQGLAAQLAGANPTLVIVGLATDPQLQDRLGKELRRLHVSAFAKQYRPPAPPPVLGIASGQAVAAGLRRSVDILGDAVDRWSKGSVDSAGESRLQSAVRDLEVVFQRGAGELRAAGRNREADQLQRWQDELEKVVEQICQNAPPGPVMTQVLQGMAHYEQLVAALESSGNSQAGK